MFVISIAALLSSPQPAWTQQPQHPVKTTFVVAEGFAESLPVRNLQPVQESETEAKGAAAIEKEKNPENRLRIRHVNPNVKPSADKALFSALPVTKKTGAIVQPQALPTPAVSFEGISQANTISADPNQGFLPPDTNGAVGPNHYVQTVNSCFRVWNKSGSPVTNTTSFVTLFSALGCGGSIDGDPIVLYDQLADRWIISEFCNVANPNDHQLVAVSKTNDPSGAYYLYDFPMPNNKFNDYPHLSVWSDAYYMTDNQFNQAGDTFQQAGVFAFNRAKMLAGDPSASFVYFDTALLFPPGATGSTNGTDGLGGVLPANVDGYSPPPSGAPCPFAYFQAGEFGDPGDQLRIFDFHVDFNTPANSSFTERTGSPLPVAAFDPVTVPDSRNVIPEPGQAATRYLDAINDRIMFRLAYRNYGSSETLVLNHTVNAAVNPSYRAGVRFYELTRSAPNAAFTIAEQQTFSGLAGDAESRWMGSVSMNFQGDIALGYSVSSSTVNPSIRYAAKLFTDPSGGGLAQGEQTLITGAGAQRSTSGRWGDYSAMTVDPSDDCAFWYTQEYYAASSTSSWQTRIAKIVVGTQATSPRGTISGTITNCSTGAPIANAVIQISGGFWRASAANGTYSATLAPGTYTASVTAPGFPGTVTSGNLVVTNGGNATFNACFSGVASITAGTATVASENFSPPNGAPDPGELVTVNLPLSNVGSSNTTNLVATLQPTGGVTNPSSPQTYGVLTAGGSAVSEPFTFVASGICGSNITLTLQLQDGATNLGTVTYTLRLGTLTSSPLFTEAYDGVVAPALPAGWTTSVTGVESAWVTSTTTPSTSPNDATAPDVTNVGNTELITPAIAVPAGGAQLTFQNLFNLEAGTPPTGYDGMVLEISINGGAFTDITSGGNAFIAGGYTYTISNSFRNALGNRQAWSGLSAGTSSAPAYIASTINLPAAAAGQSVRLKWRVSTDSSVAASGVAGARIDNISLTGLTSTCASGQAPQITNGPPPSPVIVGSPYTFSYIASGNPAPTFSVSGTLPAGLNLSSAGVLSGTATLGGTGSFPGITVTASNGVLPNATQSFALTTATQAGNYIAGFNLTGGNAALNFDYDGDGLTNLLEYALNLNPTIASVAGLPVVILKDYSGTKYLSMTFNRSSLATDLTYIVQGSSDLTNWTDLGTSAAGGATTGSGFVAETGSAPAFTVEVRDTLPYDPSGAVTRFLRLKITSP